MEIQASGSVDAGDHRVADLSSPAELHATIRCPITKAQLADRFASQGWVIGKASWVDFTLETDFADLVLEAENPLLLHGEVRDILVNAPKIAAILEAAGAAFSLECYATKGELVLKLSGGDRER